MAVTTVLRLLFVRTLPGCPFSLGGVALIFLVFEPAEEADDDHGEDGCNDDGEDVLFLLDLFFCPHDFLTSTCSPDLGSFGEVFLPALLADDVVPEAGFGVSVEKVPLIGVAVAALGAVFTGTSSFVG